MSKSKVPYQNYFLLDMTKFNQYVESMAGYSEQAEAIRKAFMTSLIHAGIDSGSATCWLVWDGASHTKRMVSVDPVPGWKRLQYRGRWVYYPGLTGFRGEITLREYRRLVSGMPSFLGDVLDRPDLILMWHPHNPYDIGITIGVDTEDQIVCLQSWQPIEDARIVPYENLQYLNTGAH